MTDEEYIFRQTSAERKRIGRGDFNKKRKGGRFVRLPSDNLTKKEREKMNGEVHNFNLSAPTRWHEFITWPKDLQVEYIQRLEEAYHAKNEDIAGMLDVSISCYRKHKNSLGIKGKSGKGKPIDRDGWAKFLGANELAPEILVESSPVVEEKVELPEKKEEKQEPVKIDHSSIMNIAILLDALKGSGAKLTIEVTL
ncbi:MAG: hypothetical protein II488_06885 [Firmicutes bacterium]|nr:hypothetical protein [Bacillota bacterium]